MKRLIYIFFSLSAIFLYQSCQSEDEITYARYYVNGKGTYEISCQSCHGADGTGLGKLYPPLTDSLFLKKNKKKLSCYIKYGVSDSIVVNKHLYHDNMPANPQLSDIEIAELITYITNSFGNKEGFYPTQAVNYDLKNCR